MRNLFSYLIIFSLSFSPLAFGQINSKNQSVRLQDYFINPTVDLDWMTERERAAYVALANSFQKSMLEIQKYVKDRKVSQRLYPQSIVVSLKDKTVTVVADRITEFDALKAATILKSKLTFDLDSPTPSNPWGIFFVKEVEGGDSQ